MSDTIVSIRITESMVKDLKEKSIKHHYLDLSESVRGVVRKKWMEWKDPSTYQIKKLREDIKEAVEEGSKKSKEERLIEELQRIKDMITGKEEVK